MHEPFLLVGSRGTGKSLCLEHVFLCLRERYRALGRTRPFRVIYVNGQLENTDVNAIAEIAAQLEMSKALDTSKKRSTGGSAAGGRGGKRRGASDQLNFIVEGMRSGTFEQAPLVFVIDHIEEFASRGGGGGNKQLLLYSLMDLQHRGDLQFVVVGISNEYVIQAFLVSSFPHSPIHPPTQNKTQARRPGPVREAHPLPHLQQANLLPPGPTPRQGPPPHPRPSLSPPRDGQRRERGNHPFFLLLLLYGRRRGAVPVRQGL